MASTWDMYDTFEQRDQEIRGLYTDLFQTPYKNLRKMIRNNGVYKIILHTTSAKEKEEEEEGTISRPSSPKEGEDGKAGAKPQVGELSGLVREGSAHSVRIGEGACSHPIDLV